MKAVLVANPTAPHQLYWAGAFATGLKHHGWQVRIDDNSSPADLVVFWSVRRSHEIAAIKARGCEVCILERGYIGDRFAFTSVSFGGKLNGEARFNRHGIDDARVRTYFPNLLKPWKSGPVRNALILGQVTGDMSIAGVNAENVLRDLAQQCIGLGFATRFRPHPCGGDLKCDSVLRMPGTLVDALAWADLAVTISSNSGVDAVVAGVPCVAMDRRSMAWDMSTRTPRHVERPDRAEWFQQLSYAQWTADEMASGECWEHARHGANV